MSVKFFSSFEWKSKFSIVGTNANRVTVRLDERILTILIKGFMKRRRCKIFLICGTCNMVSTVGRSSGFGCIIDLITFCKSVDKSNTKGNEQSLTNFLSHKSKSLFCGQFSRTYGAKNDLEDFHFLMYAISSRFLGAPIWMQVQELLYQDWICRQPL